MLDGKNLAIEHLKKQYADAIARADALHTLAAAQGNEVQAAEYRRSAGFEMDKARGYLKQAEILTKTDQ